MRHAPPLRVAPVDARGEAHRERPAVGDDDRALARGIGRAAEQRAEGERGQRTSRAPARPRRPKRRAAGSQPRMPQPDLEARPPGRRGLDLVEVVLRALVGVVADVGRRARAHHRNRSRGTLERPDQRPVTVSVQHQIDARAPQHGAQRFGVGERAAGDDRVRRGRVVEQEDPTQGRVDAAPRAGARAARAARRRASRWRGPAAVGCRGREPHEGDRAPHPQRREARRARRRSRPAAGRSAGTPTSGPRRSRAGSARRRRGCRARSRPTPGAPIRSSQARAATNSCSQATFVRSPVTTT